MKALLLIDLQNDFMPGGQLSVPDGIHCVWAANQAQRYFSSIVASKDWHPKNHLSFASSHKNKVPGQSVMLHGIEQILWPDHCVQNTYGAAFVKKLDQSKIQHVVNKGEDLELDSYSAFFDNAHRHETGLRSYLELSKIDEVYILGLATEYCVKYSAIDAINLGLKTNVLFEDCRGLALNERDIPLAKEEMLDAGVRLVTLNDIANMI